KVKGSKFPVLTNLHAGRSRLALAMNAAPEEMQRAYLRAMEKPIPPRAVSKAPVKDVILTGKRLNLYDLPQIIHHEGDAGPYFTAAISFAKDPSDDTWNCAYNRLMIKGRDTTSIHLTSAKHLWEFYRLAEARGEALPVVFAFGVHPAIALGALAIGSIDEDERGVMGALLGEPLQLVKCETSDLLVPAHAEMVIEAEILPRERTAEGPFGEFTGYSLGERQREVVKVRAITHRKGAIFQDISVSHLDHLLLSTIPIEANLYRAVRSMVPSVKAVRVPAPFTCYVSIEQRVPGQGKNAILAVLGADLYMKRVVVVDHDVDIFNDRQVNWAIATRCQPDRDITIITNARGSDLDPSTKEDGYTAKWGVDATAKPSLAAYVPRNQIPAKVWKRINLKDFLP
ncbi:MAG: UbiD family decarboxylase, partial [Candidatus Binatota bacterium]